MTIQALPIAKPQYIGASTDTKPTITSHAGLPAPATGSTFLEYDTGDMYVTYDGTNWSIKSHSDDFSEWITATIDIDRDSEFSGDDVDRYSKVVDLGAEYKAVVVEVPTIDSATVSVHVMRDATITTVPVEVHYTKSDDTTAHWAATAGTGAYSIIVMVGGYRYMRIHVGADQTADRAILVKGIGR